MKEIWSDPHTLLLLEFHMDLFHMPMMEGIELEMELIQEECVSTSSSSLHGSFWSSQHGYHQPGPPAQLIHPILHTDMAKIQDLEAQLEKRSRLEKTLQEFQTAHEDRIAERARIYKEKLDEAGRVFQMAEEAEREENLREKMAVSVSKRIKMEPIDDDDDVMICIFFLYYSIYSKKIKWFLVMIFCESFEMRRVLKIPI
ncbi:unnamed protein product [Caenorhabditis nigoni]